MTQRVRDAMGILGLAALLVWSTAAQDEPLKLGVVDIDQAISMIDEGKAAREELARKQREAEGELQPLFDRYKSLEEDLKAKKFVLSDEALFQKQLDLAEMRNKIENEMKERQGQLQVDQRRLEGPLLAKMAKTVDELGRDMGYTMIVRRGTPGFLYLREALDITDLVVERYNKKG